MKIIIELPELRCRDYRGQEIFDLIIALIGCMRLENKIDRED